MEKTKPIGSYFSNRSNQASNTFDASSSLQQPQQPKTARQESSSNGHPKKVSDHLLLQQAMQEITPRGILPSDAICFPEFLMQRASSNGIGRPSVSAQSARQQRRKEEASEFIIQAPHPPSKSDETTGNNNQGGRKIVSVLADGLTYHSMDLINQELRGTAGKPGVYDDINFFVKNPSCTSRGAEYKEIRTVNCKSVHRALADQEKAQQAWACKSQCARSVLQKQKLALMTKRKLEMDQQGKSAQPFLQQQKQAEKSKPSTFIPSVYNPFPTISPVQGTRPGTTEFAPQTVVSDFFERYYHPTQTFLQHRVDGSNAEDGRTSITEQETTVYYYRTSSEGSDEGGGASKPKKKKATKKKKSRVKPETNPRLTAEEQAVAGGEKDVKSRLKRQMSEEEVGVEDSCVICTALHQHLDEFNTKLKGGIIGGGVATRVKAQSTKATDAELQVRERVAYLKQQSAGSAVGGDSVSVLSLLRCFDELQQFVSQQLSLACQYNLYCAFQHQFPTLAADALRAPKPRLMMGLKDFLSAFVQTPAISARTTSSSATVPIQYASLQESVPVTRPSTGDVESTHLLSLANTSYYKSQYSPMHHRQLTSPSFAKDGPGSPTTFSSRQQQSEIMLQIRSKQEPILGLSDEEYMKLTEWEKLFIFYDRHLSSVSSSSYGDNLTGSVNKQLFLLNVWIASLTNCGEWHTLGHKPALDIVRDQKLVQQRIQLILTFVSCFILQRIGDEQLSQNRREELLFSEFFPLKELVATELKNYFVMNQEYQIWLKKYEKGYDPYALNRYLRFGGGSKSSTFGALAASTFGPSATGLQAKWGEKSRASRLSNYSNEEGCSENQSHLSEPLDRHGRYSSKSHQHQKVTGSLPPKAAVYAEMLDRLEELANRCMAASQSVPCQEVSSLLMGAFVDVSM